MTSTCTCADWAENHQKMLDVCVIAQVHGFPYHGKKFTHCPWCGTPLVLVDSSDDDAEADE